MKFYSQVTAIIQYNIRSEINDTLARVRKANIIPRPDLQPGIEIFFGTPVDCVDSNIRVSGQGTSNVVVGTERYTGTSEEQLSVVVDRHQPLQPVTAHLAPPVTSAFTISKREVSDQRM